MNRIWIDVEHGFQYFLWETKEDPVETFHNNMPQTCLDPPDILPGILTEVVRPPLNVTHYVAWHESGDSFIKEINEND